uniref:Immunoglobulin V-set domain-containing protein n=1 Tax=Podarcis muralis TaxID=64176 RepID=A0A670JAV6_PODMU
MASRLLSRIIILTWVLTGPVEVHGYEGKSLSLRCRYQQTFEDNTKSCLISSDGKVNMGRVSLRENKKEHYFQVTMDSLNLDDSGVYYCWCGIERTGSDVGFPVNNTVLPGESHFQTSVFGLNNGGGNTPSGILGQSH